MELRHLESFVAVAEELHFSRAAERLHIAQSPLSQRIRALEAELGVRLLERTNRRVSLTDAGEAVLVEARRTLHAAAGARRVAQRARDGEVGTLRLGFVASDAFVRLPSLLRGLRADVPDVRIELRRLSTTAQVQALHADRIDAGLARTPPAPSERLAALDLEPEPLLAVLAADHPLASRPSIPLASLADEPWVLSIGSSPSDLEVRVRHGCARAGFDPTVAHHAPDLPSVLGLVAGRLGVSVVPSGVARLRAPGVSAVPLEAQDAIALPSSLVWHPDRTRGVVQRLIDIARSTGLDWP